MAAKRQGWLQQVIVRKRRARAGVRVTLVEREEVAASSSGKAGGFLARDWGDAATRALHVKSFELHAELADELGIESWRPIPTLSVGRGRGGGASGAGGGRHRGRADHESSPGRLSQERPDPPCRQGRGRSLTRHADLRLSM